MSNGPRGRLVIVPSDLYLKDCSIRAVTLPDDDRVRQTYAEIDGRAMERQMVEAGRQLYIDWRTSD